MGQTSTVDALPSEVKTLINEWLEQHAFGGYDGLVEKLAELGYEISRSALHRYGQRVKEASEEMRRAAKIAADIYASNGGDFSKLTVTTQALLQQKVFQFLIENDFDTSNLTSEDQNDLMVKVMRFLPNISKAQAVTDEWAINRPAVIKEVSQKVAAHVAQAAEKEGLNSEQASRIGEAAASGVKIYLPDNGR